MDCGEIEAAAESVLEEAAAQLHSALVELAGQMRPFPGFMGMASVQALELNPPFRPAVDRGCVVALPTGEIRQLELSAASRRGYGVGR